MGADFLLRRDRGYLMEGFNVISIAILNET